jgi:hypothetical protein
MTNSDSKQTEDLSNDLEITNSSGRLRVMVELTVAALILVGIYYLFAPEEAIELPSPLEENQIDPIIKDQIDSVKVIEPDKNTQNQNGAAETEVQLQSEEPDRVEQPKISTTEPADLGTAAQASESAREIISKLRSGKLTLDSTTLIKKSEAFTRQGRLDDTYLLLFYAAREGDGVAAFALATFYDPHHFRAGNALLEKPNVFQAHKWYMEAAKLHIDGAEERLAILRNDVEKQAESGNPAAQRLLLNWR